MKQKTCEHQYWWYLSFMELSNDVNSLLLYRICNLQQQVVPQWRIQVFPGRGREWEILKMGAQTYYFGHSIPKTA